MRRGPDRRAPNAMWTALRERARRHPVVASSLLAGALYVVYRYLYGDEDDHEDVDDFAGPRRPPMPPRHERQPSFTIQSDGQTRGALEDARAHQWGWLVDAHAPLAPTERKTKPAPVLRHKRRPSGQTGSEYSGSDLELRDAQSASDSGYRSDDSTASLSLHPGGGSLASARKAVRFRLDERAGFYGFVFTYEGVCVAHGADPSFVGLTLTQVLERTGNDQVEGASLHERFVHAADAGGGFVSYSWRNERTKQLLLKGSYIIKVTQWDRDFYAGVGYTLVPPPPPSPKPESARPESARAHAGLYSFVCTQEGVLLAHGACKSFVGRSLADVIDENCIPGLTLPSLLARFDAASALGGGWVHYPWRNSAEAPVRKKGAWVTRIERPSAGATAGENGPRRSPGPSQYLFAGVGYFGGLSRRANSRGRAGGPPAPPPIPPSLSAAKAATAALRSQLEGVEESAIDVVVSDVSGEIAASAAEAVCWEATDTTDLPAELAKLLRDHTTLHIKSFNH